MDIEDCSVAQVAKLSAHCEQRAYDLFSFVGNFFGSFFYEGVWKRNRKNIADNILQYLRW